MTAVPHDEAYLLEIAGQIGSRQAAEQAIAERDRRISLGHDVELRWEAATGILWIEDRVKAAAEVVQP